MPLPPRQPPGTGVAAGAADPGSWPGVPGRGGELAVVTRSGFVESRHHGHAALVLVGSDGWTPQPVAAIGMPEATVFPRSSLKPFQASAALLAGADLHGAAAAMSAASHRGHPDHLELVDEMLRGAGMAPSALQTPPTMPGEQWARDDWVRAGAGPAAIAHNCSGKHAGMLAACAAAEWDTASYRDPAHPLQRLVRRVVEVATGVAVERVGVDGCGAPLFTTTVAGLATAFARLAAATSIPEAAVPRRPDPDDVTAQDVRAALGRIGRAMRAHPWTIAGIGAPDTVIMQDLDATVAKGGAEAVMGLGTRRRDGAAGVAVKVLDGGDRAGPVTGLALLAEAGVPTAALVDAIAPRTLGHGEAVGQVHPVRADLRPT